jgi:hypothetical protein
VAKLLQNKLLARVGAWSFGVYILHFEVLALWGGAESGKGVGLAYWVVLLAMAALAHHYVQVPWGTDLVHSFLHACAYTPYSRTPLSLSRGGAGGLSLSPSLAAPVQTYTPLCHVRVTRAAAVCTRYGRGLARHCALSRCSHHDVTLPS